ncbi:MAG: hypothetical protein HZB51_11565 [Chloroflexi bacterium]|nr:hypothetical protein [Chloroflexota bacterium]
MLTAVCLVSTLTLWMRWDVLPARADACTYLDKIAKDWNDADNWDCGHVPGTTDVANVPRGIANVPSGTTVNTLNVYNADNGTHFGDVRPQGNLTVQNLYVDRYASFPGQPGTVTVNGTLNWEGGPMSGGFTLNLPPGATLNFTQLKNALPNNLGANLVNAGTINVLSGTLGVPGGTNFVVTNTATISVSTGATMTLDAPRVYLGQGTKFLGGGIVQLTSGNAVVSGTIETQNLVFGNPVNGGVLSGTATISGTMRWLGGQMHGGGVLTIPVSSTLNIGGGTNNKTLDQFTISNFGTINWTEIGDIVGSNGAIFNNQSGALLNAQADADFVDGTPANKPTFNNAGTVRKAAGSGMTTFGHGGSNGIIFNNTGAVEVMTGTIQIGGNGGAGTSNGNFNALAGTLIEFTRATTHSPMARR